MNQNLNKAFIYWDNSNIFISARGVAEEREGAGAYHQVRINFKNLLSLAKAERAIGHAVAVGSIPPEMSHLWNRIEQQNVEVHWHERGANSNTEQGVDEKLQNVMLMDALIHNGSPGTVVLLTGDGRGFHQDVGFHKTVEQMHKKDWKIEILAWTSSCHKYMLEWIRAHGTFIALEDFYENITFLEKPEPGMEHVLPRYAQPVDFSRRP